MKYTHTQIIFQTRINRCPILGHRALCDYFTHSLTRLTQWSLMLVGCSLLIGCSSVRNVSIETYAPADVTFPSNTFNVVVVNNAVLQPADFGHSMQQMNKKVESYTMPTDSVLSAACKSLAASIHQQRYFRKTLLLNTPIRQDQLYYIDRKLSASQVDSICNVVDAGAIISIDRMLFNGKRSVVSHEGFLYGSQRVDITAIIRAYIPNRANPLATVQIVDSLEWVEASSNRILLDQILPTANEALRETAAYVSSKVYRNFVPNWVATERTYYSSIESRWKEATAFAAKSKWAEANMHWMELFNRTKSTLSKARLASNIALSYEMMNEFKQATDWLEKSEALYLKQPKDKYTDEVARVTLYKEILNERIRSDVRLNMQIN